jgi:protein-S-isoprenylcysteine O-methyltransferase Ste14
VSERATNLILGSNVLAWAVLGIISSSPADRLAVVRVCITLLNLLVGMLLIARRPLHHSGSMYLCAICTPSFVACGLAFYLAPQPDQWPHHAAGLFAIGAAMTGISFACLGRRFAVLPADRGTIVQGPYRLVRHPAYAGELLMVAACFVARPALIALLPMTAAVPLMVIRILAEERLLTRSGSYREYAGQVAWRLLPGVW